MLRLLFLIAGIVKILTPPKQYTPRHSVADPAIVAISWSPLPAALRYRIRSRALTDALGDRDDT